MPLQPILVNGQVRLLSVEVGAEAQEEWLTQQENTRRAEIWKRRMYYGGEQYEAENRETAEALGIDWLTGRLPEHHRKHPYSTQIGESVDFLSDQMIQRFAIEAESPDVQEVIDATFDGFPILNTVRDTLMAGDVAVKVVGDPVTGIPRPLVYPSEAVRVDFDPDDSERMVRVSQEDIVWRDGPTPQVLRRREWRYVNDILMFQLYEDDELVNEEPLAVIPWQLIRCGVMSLTATRGESVITFQGMQCADRYNAVEQVGWLIARYNSHGNLAVIGDAASLKAQQEERIEKDVADVLTFPGGTAVTAVSLPTDPAMITHQRIVLLDALYATFGLTRIDQETITGYGGISGYALEILNRKTDGTFDRLRKALAADLTSLVNLILETVTLATGREFPVRDVDVRLGGVYVVDDVQVRDDFVAGLISRQEALRKRGYDDDEIADIIAEIDEDAPPAAETGTFGLPEVMPTVVPDTTATVDDSELLRRLP